MNAHTFLKKVMLATLIPGLFLTSGCGKKKKPSQVTKKVVSYHKEIAFISPDADPETTAKVTKKL